MKKLSKSLLLVALLAVYCLPAWSQSSTEGKEFWVGLTMAIRPPDDGDGEASPYLAISTKEATTVLFSNPAFPSETFTETIGAFQWKKIEIPKKWWYPSGVGNPGKVKGHADEVNNYGVYIKATKNISVFAILRAGAGMDASNILPTTALQTEYILQDYVPHAKSGDAPYTTMATILATEDNTQISVTPKGTLLKATTPRLVNNKITLNKGQTYYLMAENSGTDHNCLSGTEITADKKIAVFQGVPCTYVPQDVGNRDCLYEQAMPVDYWGTEFVATRSYAKGANIIRITASNDNQQTSIYVNGTNVASINRGETYEIELAANTPDKMDNSNKKTLNSNLRIIGEYVHIKTSCPVAVYSYDCGKGYTDKDDKELDPDEKQQGDPSSVWIAPMEQSIDQITFGACGTKKDGGNFTEHHYLDIVVETASVNQTVLYSYLAGAPMDITGSFKPIAGTKYSYARVYLAKADDTKNAVFTVANPNGLVAHVYGNGESESYSYSVGSAAVVQGVKVNGDIYTNGFVSDDKFCMGTSNNVEIHFDAKVGTDEITRVDWDFGDGISENHGAPQTAHTYYTPGWYDVTASLYGHQICTDESEMPLGSIRFTFRIVKPDTVPGNIVDSCISLADYKANPAYWDNIIANPVITYSEPEHCYDDVLRNYVMYHRETEEVRDTIKGKDVAYGYNGIKYTVSQDVVDTIRNSGDTCYHFIRYYVKVISCLDISVANNPAAQHACLGENITVTYTKTKGDIDGKAILKVPGYADQEVDISNDTVTNANLVIPTGHITNPGTYKAQLLIKDENCGDTKTFDIDIAIYYPADIFTYEFNNVLAVWQKGYGGNVNPGWDFTAYQWYRNGTPIDGATSSVYHTAEPFTKNDEYYVELTRRDGLTLRSCSQTIIFVDDFTKPEQEEVEPSSDTQQAPSAMPAKLIRNQQMLILHDGEEYNMFGQRVR